MWRPPYRGKKRGVTMCMPHSYPSRFPRPNLASAMNAFNCENTSAFHPNLPKQIRRSTEQVNEREVVPRRHSDESSWSKPKHSELERTPSKGRSESSRYSSRDEYRKQKEVTPKTSTDGSNSIPVADQPNKKETTSNHRSSDNLTYSSKPELNQKRVTSRRRSSESSGSSSLSEHRNKKETTPTQRDTSSSTSRTEQKKESHIPPTVASKKLSPDTSSSASKTEQKKESQIQTTAASKKMSPDASSSASKTELKKESQIQTTVASKRIASDTSSSSSSSSASSDDKEKSPYKMVGSKRKTPESSSISNYTGRATEDAGPSPAKRVCASVPSQLKEAPIIPSEDALMETDSARVGNNSEIVNLRFTEFVELVCSKENVNEDNVADVFLRELVSTLFELTDVLVNMKPKIHKILSLMIELGVKCSNLNQNTDDLDGLMQISSYKSVEYNDPRLNDVSILLEIDKKIETLMEKKKKLYPQILKPNANDVIVLDDDFNASYSSTSTSQLSNNLENLARRIKTESDCPMTSSCYPTNNVQEVCQQQRNMLRVVKMEFLTNQTVKSEPDIMASNTSVLSSPTTETTSPTQNSSLVLPPVEMNKKKKEKLVGKKIKEKPIKLPSTPPPGSETDSTSTFATFELPPKNNKILCIQVLKKLCVTGCDDGCLMLFSMRNGRLVDLVFPHEKKLVSITVWQMKIITASEDSWIKCYNLKRKQLKSINASYPISCTDEKKGILFVGTSTGHLIRYNIRSMTQITNIIQLSSTSIDSMKAFDNENIVAIACKGKPISLRDTSNGALLQTVKAMSNIDEIILTKNSEKIIGFRDNELFIFNTSTGQLNLRDAQFHVSILQYYKNVIMIGGIATGQRNGVLAFLSETTKELGRISLPLGKPLAVFIFSSSQIIVSTEKVRLSILQLPSNLSKHLNKFNDSF